MAVRAPLKAIVPVVLVSVTVAASTAPPKVVPPELVMVRVPILVPTAPLTLTIPEVLIVRFLVPLEGPVMAAKLIGVDDDAPAPTVRLLFKLIFPVVIWPVDAPPIVESPAIVTAVSLSPRETMVKIVRYVIASKNLIERIGHAQLPPGYCISYQNVLGVT